MTINSSIAEIVREVAGMKREDLTDSYLLNLHTRGMTAAGRLPETITARRGAILRLADHLDPYAENPRALLGATTDQLAEWQASKVYLAAKSMREYVGHVQLYYNWLIRPMRAIDESPAEWLTKPIVRRRRPRPIPENDLEYALDVCVDPRQRTWLILGSFAGLRSVDIAGLERDDVLTDREFPMLRVRGKGDNEDLIVVGYEVLAALEPFMSRRGPLFVDEAGRRVTTRRIRDEMNGFFKRVGLSYTFHQARHRYGTRLYAIVKDIRYAQKQLRHRSVVSTEVYVAVPTEQDSRAMKALDDDLSKHPHGRRRRDLGA